MFKLVSIALPALIALTLAIGTLTITGLMILSIFGG